MKFSYEEFDLSWIKTYPLKSRPSKARTDDFGRPLAANASAAAFIESLPNILAAAVPSVTLTNFTTMNRDMQNAYCRQAGVEVNLARAAELFGESAQLLDELAREDAVRIAPGASGSLSALRQLGAARGRNLLRYLLVERRALPPAMDRLVEALRQLHEAEEGVRLAFDGQVLCAWRDAFWIEADAARHVAESIWRGEAVLPWAGGTLSFTVASGPDALRVNPEGDVRFVVRQGGERLRPHADGPTRAFKQLAQEAAIPPWQRERLPCLWQGDELIWIAELGANANWRCAEGEAGWRVEWRRDSQ